MIGKAPLSALITEGAPASAGSWPRMALTRFSTSRAAWSRLVDSEKLMLIRALPSEEVDEIGSTPRSPETAFSTGTAISCSTSRGAAPG